MRARISEFLGLEAGFSRPTAFFVTIGDEHGVDSCDPRKAWELPACLKPDCEICRSLWDSSSLLVDLDIEYVNFDFPAEPYLNPGRTFSLQEIVAATVEKKLLSFGIAPLHLLSGRGHHFLWRIRQQAASFEQLRELGHLTASMRSHYKQTVSAVNATVDQSLGTAYHGLGQVIEFLAAEVKRVSAPSSQIPVELTALEVGPGVRGREMISFDISQFGDPLDTRCARAPFSRYLKSVRQEAILGDQICQRLPPMFGIPLFEMSIEKALSVMRRPKAVRDLAERASGLIPDCSAAMEKLISSYAASPLARFHRYFYSTEPDPPELWPRTYDRTNFQQLPPCACFILEHPNDLPLRPSGMRRVVTILLSLGWHPRHVAGLIQSKFEGDYTWGKIWERYDPATRAEFYTRLFSGLVAARYDDLVDLNCQSAREQLTCHVADCRENLQRFKQSLLDQRGP
jgi:hypothetical protein